MLLSDDVTYQFVLSCLIRKHLSLALSVFVFIFGITNGSRVILTVLGNKKSIQSSGNTWTIE